MRVNESMRASLTRDLAPRWPAMEAFARTFRREFLEDFISISDEESPVQGSECSGQSLDLGLGCELRSIATGAVDLETPAGRL